MGAGSLPEAVSTLVNQNGRFVQFHGYLTDELLHMLYSSIKVGGRWGWWVDAGVVGWKGGKGGVGCKGGKCGVGGGWMGWG